MSIAGKILARVLLNRLNEHLERSGLLPESQCGVRKNRGTIDMVFTTRQLQEKCQEQNVDLYMTFVDLTKAFDTVFGLWKIMAKFGCPAKFIAMVRQFHDGLLARVQNDGEFSDPFPVTNAVKQDCVLASTLFSMMFSAMLTDFVCLFDLGLTSLSTIFQSYRDVVWMWQGAQCSLLRCCLTEISRPRHFDMIFHPVTLY